MYRPQKSFTSKDCLIGRATAQLGYADQIILSLCEYPTNQTPSAPSNLSARMRTEDSNCTSVRRCSPRACYRCIFRRRKKTIDSAMFLLDDNPKLTNEVFRMAKKHKSVTISVKLDERVKKLLEDSSAELGLSLSEYARNIIYCALSDLKILKNLKLLYFESFSIYLNPKNSHLKIDDTEPAGEVNISVIIREDVKNKLEKIAEGLGMTMKQVVRNFIYVGLYEHDVLRKFGFVKIGKMANGFIANIQKVFGPDEK